MRCAIYYKVSAPPNGQLAYKSLILVFINLYNLLSQHMKQLEQQRQHGGQDRRRPPHLETSVFHAAVGASEPQSARVHGASQLTVIEMGGFHSTMLPVCKAGEVVGGAAYVADAVTYFRQKTDPVLISNGDVFTGQTSALENGGSFVMQFLNQLQFDAMTLGIHDFDEGQEVLAGRIAQAKFPILAANLANAETGQHVSQCKTCSLSRVAPFAVVERGMQVLVVIGLMKEETPMFQSPANLRGLAFWSAKKSIMHWLPEILAAKPNVIIVQYNTMSETEELAVWLNEQIHCKTGKAPPLMVFVGGHLDQKPIHGPNYLIMQGTDRGYKLGVIKIKRALRGTQFDPEYAVISAKHYAPEDKVSRLVEVVQTRIKQQEEFLGSTRSPLQRHRFHDCTLGILVTESMRRRAKTEAAFVSSGTIKLDIPAGDIFASSLDHAIPFRDTIMRVEIVGEKIAEVLEQTARLEADSGGSGGKVLQVAGVRFRYDKTLEKGKRVLEATINGKAIEPGRVYTTAVSNYLVEGGDGYPQFKEGKVLAACGDLKDAIREYIRAAGTLELKRDMRIEDVA